MSKLRGSRTKSKTRRASGASSVNERLLAVEKQLELLDVFPDQRAKLENTIEDLKGRLQLARLGGRLGAYEYRWETADGRKVAPGQMEESHLRNIISYCSRRLITRLSSTRFLLDEEKFITGLSRCLEEARRRGLRV